MTECLPVKKNEPLIVLRAITLITLFARGAEADPLLVPPPTKLLHKEHPRLLASADDFARLKPEHNKADTWPTGSELNRDVH